MSSRRRGFMVGRPQQPSGKSWGHSVAPIGAPERLPEWHRTCRAGKCSEPSRWRTRYFYVTGRWGRTGTWTKFVCDTHAQQFAERHKLPAPARAAVAALDAEHGQ